MNILITGATGMVGSSLIDELITLKLPIKLGLVVRNIEKCKPSWLQDSNIQIILFSESDDFVTSIENFSPDIVIHLASYLSSNSDKAAINELIDSNIKFGTLILNALLKTKLKLFINVGTFAEYHNNSPNLEPTYLYAATKSAFRSIIKFYESIIEFKTIHVIPYTIYGALEEKKKAIDIIIDSLSSKESIPMSEGTQKLDFIHINDVIDFFIFLIFNSNEFENNEVIHLGTGVGTSLREIAVEIEKITGLSTNISWGAKENRLRDSLFATAQKPNKIIWKSKIELKEGIQKYLSKKIIIS